MIENLSKLQDYTKDEVEDAIESIERCCDLIDAMSGTLKLFRDNDEKNPVLIGSLDGYIKEIFESKGYKCFLTLYQIYVAEDLKIIPDVEAVIDYITNNLALALPWPCNKQFIYHKNIEENYLDLSVESSIRKINTDTDILYEVDSEDPLIEVALQEIKKGALSPRAKEIFDLWTTQKIYNLLNKNIVLKGFKNQNKLEEKLDSDYLDSLLESYLNKLIIRKDILEKLPRKDLKLNDEIWFRLSNVSGDFIYKVLQLKEKHKNALFKYKKDKNEILMEDIIKFIRREKLDESIIPPVRVMQKRDDGPGLVKRCNEFRIGNQKGMAIAREAYSKYILDNNIAKRNLNKIQNSENTPQQPETVKQ